MTSQEASAKKAKAVKPNAPVIVSVETRPVKKKNDKADVIVTVALPTNVPKKSITSTEVLIGKQKWTPLRELQQLRQEDPIKRCAELGWRTWLLLQKHCRSTCKKTLLENRPGN